MIARWKERTVRRPSVGRSIARRLSLFKNMSTHSLPPYFPPSRATDSPPSFLPLRGHGQRVNQLESEPRSLCSLRVPRPSSLVPPLPSASFGLFFFFSVSVSPLFGIPLHFASVGKTASNGQFQIPWPPPPPLRHRFKPPQFRARARPLSCFDSEKTEGETGTEMAAVDSGLDSDGLGPGMQSGGRGCASVHLCLYQTQSGGKEGGRLIFHANRISFRGNRPRPLALSRLRGLPSRGPMSIGTLLSTIHRMKRDEAIDKWPILTSPVLPYLHIRGVGGGERRSMERRGGQGGKEGRKEGGETRWFVVSEAEKMTRNKLPPHSLRQRGGKREEGRGEEEEEMEQEAAVAVAVAA